MSQLILVVDDEPKVARLARDYLEKNGFRIITASNDTPPVPPVKWLPPSLAAKFLKFRVSVSLCHRLPTRGSMGLS